MEEPTDEMNENENEEGEEGATPSFPVEEETGPCKQTTFCIHGIAVELMPAVGMIEIWAKDLIVNPEMTCENTTLSLWHPAMLNEAPASASNASGLSSSLIFTCEQLGTQVVEVHTVDEAVSYTHLTLPTIYSV